MYSMSFLNCKSTQNKLLHVVRKKTILLSHLLTLQAKCKIKFIFSILAKDPFKVDTFFILFQHL